MPFVSGFLRTRKRRPGKRPVDPDYGIDEGEFPEVLPPEGEDGTPEFPIVDPPPGLWPPLTPEHPWRPVPGFPERPGHGLPPSRPPAGIDGGPPPQPGQPLPPTEGGGDEEVYPPPGAIWPPLPGGVHGKYWALALVRGPRGFHWRYVCVDADARPPMPGHPDQGGPGYPEREPKR